MQTDIQDLASRLDRLVDGFNWFEITFIFPQKK